MWVLPFLYYYHAYPITTFYHEWGAAILGLSAGVFLLSKQHWVQPEVPRIVLLPIGLMILVLLQYLLGKLAYFDQALLFTLYMLWVVLLMMLGRVLRVHFGLHTMAMALAVFLLLGAELSALVGVLQHFHLHTIFDSVVTAKLNITVYGNLAQPNHYANYITLGLISLGLLRPHLRAWHRVLLALPLLYVLVLSGSRSTWLYFMSMAVMAYLWQRKDKSYKYLWHYTLLLMAGFGLMHGLAQLPLLTGSTGNVTVMQRMMAGDTHGSIRLYLWHEAWLIFAQFPLLGAGWGQFSWQHFQMGPALQTPYINGLYNNAHNLVMQLAAEMGLAGVLVLLSTVGLWLWQGVRASHTLAHWWGYSVLAVMGLHSMLEYPLWYAYFIGIAAFLLGALDNSTFKLELKKIGRLLVASVLMLGLVTLLQLQYAYQDFEKAISSHPRLGENKTPTQHMHDGLIAVYDLPILQPYVALYMNRFIEISSEELEKKLALNETAMRFVPISNVVYLRAALLAQNEKLDDAKIQIERAIWAYPADYTAKRLELAALAQKDPARFAALLEFANQKYEEYISAVSTK